MILNYIVTISYKFIIKVITMCGVPVNNFYFLHS